MFFFGWLKACIKSLIVLESKWVELFIKSNETFKTETQFKERFRSLAKNYYRGADAILLIFDVTDPKSFIDLPSWLEELAKFSAVERNVLQILVGNKVRFRSIELFIAIFLNRLDAYRYRDLEILLPGLKICLKLQNLQYSFFNSIPII